MLIYFLLIMGGILLFYWLLPVFYPANPTKKQEVITEKTNDNDEPNPPMTTPNVESLPETSFVSSEEPVKKIKKARKPRSKKVP